jgi:hypothetical protein
MNGNSTAIENNILVNCQQVAYSENWVYITATGVPAYPTGPFNDGNPSQATNQNAIFKIPLNPTVNEGTKTESNAGNIGIFINGVALFDYRDGVAWNNNTKSLCGGPGNPPCPGGPQAKQSWNRDAIIAERAGFDCAKGHPAMGNYHHHQNPSAFKLDKEVVSTICNLYDADGLYVIDENEHSPLIGFAYDGFPIYGAIGYANADGTGGLTRIKSSYQLRDITVRTHHSDGTDVSDGPDISSTYPIGYFREDYEYVAHSDDDSYLDVHNGRFCVTPEYPEGIYCYFATVDEDYNSTYPYVVGPTFYGNVTASKVTSIDEEVTIYENSTSSVNKNSNELNVTVFPNPSSDLIAIQFNNIVKVDYDITLMDLNGKVIEKSKINKGQTIAYFDIQTLYSGMYIVDISSNGISKKYKVNVSK